MTATSGSALNKHLVCLTVTMHFCTGFSFFVARVRRLRTWLAQASDATEPDRPQQHARAQTHAYRPRKIKTHRSDQREFIRVLGREERVSVIAEESSPRGAYNASTYVLRRCGGCRWMPPLERLLNASRAANGVDDASAADALAAVWETRVLATFKQ